MKLAIIASGGGMSCTYLAGVLLALAEKYKLKDPDIAIGGSGSSITLAYYVAHQYRAIRHIGLDLLTQKRFINPLRIWKIADVDYLIDTICTKKVPLHVEKIKKAKTKLLVCTTDIQSGNPTYFDLQKSDVKEVLRASLALPLAYGKKVKVGDKTYIDTPISTSVELHTLHALSMGADTFIIINNEFSEKAQDAFGKTIGATKSKRFRDNYMKHVGTKKQFKIPKNVRAIFLQPKHLKVHVLNNNIKLVSETMEQGYTDACENEELKKLCNML